MNSWMDGRTNGWKDGGMKRRMVQWKDWGLKDGWREGLMDEQMDK